MAPLVDLLRLFVGVAILSFAAYTDWMWRRAPNVLWTILAAAGALLLALEFVLARDATVAAWPYLVGIPVFAGVMFAFWWLGLIAGGADAKALMALALVAPFPLALADGVPRFASPMPGSFSVLANSLVLFLAIPLTLAVYNLAHGHARFPHLFLGVKREARHVRRGHQWPMEIVQEDGSRRTRLFASRMSDAEISENFERIQALGAQKVWVTPKIPFMIPLLGGYLVAFTLGDLLFAAMGAILPAR